MIHSAEPLWHKQYERYDIEPYIQMPAADTSLLDIIERCFQKFAEQTALIYRDKRLSFQTLDKLSQSIACYLQSLQLNVGDKVAIMLPNILHYPVLMYAILRAGMVVVNLNPQLKPNELYYQLSDSQAKVLFLFHKCSKNYAQIASLLSLQHVVTCYPYELMYQYYDKPRLSLWWKKVRFGSDKLKHSISFHQANEIGKKHQKITGYQRPQLTLQSLAVLQYTGGTTGTAKGALLSHGNLVANLLQNNHMFRVIDKLGYNYDYDGRVEDVVLVILPLYHIYAFMVCGLFSMYRGKTSLLIDKLNIDIMLKSLKKYQPSYVVGVNTLYLRLLQDNRLHSVDFSHTKACVAGGMAVSFDVAKKWHEMTGMPIIEGYGLSETSPVVCCNPLNLGRFTGKAGMPLPSTDMILLDDVGKRVAIGERGEICVKGPQVMCQYHNAVELTQKSFTADGYFKTGDIGIMDQQGLVKIVDRKKDMIIVSGFNVYPAEIEEVMLSHPAVMECAVIGIPNNERGEDPKMYVVKAAEVDADELLQYGKQHLIGYKRPRQVQFLDELPKTEVGKVLRKELKKMEGLV